MRRAIVAIVVGCGASPPATTPPPAAETENQIAERERVRKDELSAAHRERLDEQSTALAAGCDKGQPAKPRCLPSCYAPEGADSREGKQLAGPVEIMHTVCARGEDGPFFVADELAAKLEVRKLRGRFPAANKKGTWQADVEAAAASALEPELARGDVVRVTGSWNPVTHPVTKERLRCVPVSHYAKSARRPFDTCGSQGAVACEAKGDSSSHGINVVHYRLLEARRLQSDGKTSECQQAALEAIAVARGMPRWRQYMSLNTDQWKPAKRYRTRFDGFLDEDALFARAIELGTEAEAVYAACGGSQRPKTDVAQEQSFHMCW